jgi:hypothetical protein
LAVSAILIVLAVAVKWSAIWVYVQRFVKARVSHYLIEVSPSGARGNSRLRGYFVQASVALLSSRNSKAQSLKEWYERIRRKKGRRTARIALARKLGLIAFGVLKTNTPYDPVKVTKKKVTVTDTVTDTDTDTDAKAEPNQRD